MIYSKDYFLPFWRMTVTFSCPDNICYNTSWTKQYKRKRNKPCHVWCMRKEGLVLDSVVNDNAWHRCIRNNNNNIRIILLSSRVYSIYFEIKYRAFRMINQWLLYTYCTVTGYVKHIVYSVSLFNVIKQCTWKDDSNK